MSDQPEAFRLIDTFVSKRDLAWHVSASAELRRLHEENERLRAELAEAEAVRERCNERAFRLEAEVERLRDELRQSSIDHTCAEVERLREALKKYGQHRSDCAITLGGYQCTCGFNQQG